MVTKNILQENNINLIPISDLEITYDPEKTTGYDLTVEDFYTFSSYDGVFVQDTMAIFHPITNESQQEIQEKMMKAEGVKTFKSVTFSLSKEMCVGLFIITKNIKKTSSPIYVTEEDLEKATDPYIPVTYRKKTTTMGKSIFNSCFPLNFPFYDGIVTKSIVNNMIPEIVEKYGRDIAIETFSKLEKVGFKWATIMSPGISFDNIEIPESIIKLKQKLEGASTEEADALLKEMLILLKEYLKDTGLGDLVESGSTKGWNQPFQILVAKGIIADPAGNILPAIKGSFVDGFTNKEYFEASAGARKGIIDRTINTSDTGYLSRQLAFVLNSVEIHPHLRDCGTKSTLNLRLTKDMISRLEGRYIKVGNKVELFDPKENKPGDIIFLRTPIFCKSPKLCHVCYGKLLEKHRSPYAGIIAAQILGESGTQTVMRSFHLGGGIKIFTRNLIEDILSNDPLVELEK